MSVCSRIQYTTPQYGYADYLRSAGARSSRAVLGGWGLYRGWGGGGYNGV